MRCSILIRFDDICPTMNFQQFEKAMEIMDRYDVKPLLGVIPNCIDPDLQIEETHTDFWDYIKGLQAKGYTLAMHGVDHVFNNNCRGTVVTRWNSEFAGHTLKEQVKKIKRGKNILETHGIHTAIFFAPGHSYDDNTLKALAECGFKYLSDGKSRKPYTKYGIKCLPCRSGGIPAMKFGTIHTVVLHAHEWAIPGKEHIYDDFARLIKNHHDEIISWYEFSQIANGCNRLQILDEKIYVFYQRYLYKAIKRIVKLIRGK